MSIEERPRCRDEPGLEVKLPVTPTTPSKVSGLVTRIERQQRRGVLWAVAAVVVVLPITGNSWVPTVTKR